MRGILAAIRNAMARIRLVWVAAANGIGMVLRQVVDNSAATYAGAGVPAVDPVVEHVLDPDAKDARCEAIRKLAVAILGREDTPVMYAKIGDRDGTWLATVSRIGLARIACASDRAILAHIAGGQTIRGVTAADPASVALKIQALAMEEMSDIPDVQARTDDLIAASHSGQFAGA